MQEDDLAKYCALLEEDEFVKAIIIDPATVVTAPWVRFKCQFGCPAYDRSYCCPPYTPTPEQTRDVLDSYQRAMLVRYEAHNGEERRKRLRDHYERMTARDNGFTVEPLRDKTDTQIHFCLMLVD